MTEPGEEDGHEVPGTFCRQCGKYLDRSMCPYDESLVPGDGDLSICISCGLISVYTETGLLRAPTPDELTEALADPDVQRVLAAFTRAAAG
jgi:hypothetical protein